MSDRSAAPGKTDDKRIVNDLDIVNYWYKKSAEDDNKVALFNLGKCHELGECENLDLAFEFYKSSANKGFIDAQYKVGYYYDHGMVVEVNKEKAFDLYEAAAKEENSDAQRSLAFLYEQGEGTKKNIENAIYWYEKAIKNGCQEAKEILNKYK